MTHIVGLHGNTHLFELTPLSSIYERYNSGRSLNWHSRQGCWDLLVTRIPSLINLVTLLISSESVAGGLTSLGMVYHDKGTVGGTSQDDHPITYPSLETLLALAGYHALGDTPPDLSSGEILVKKAMLYSPQGRKWQGGNSPCVSVVLYVGRSEAWQPLCWNNLSRLFV